MKIDTVASPERPAWAARSPAWKVSTRRCPGHGAGDCRFAAKQVAAPFVASEREHGKGPSPTALAFDLEKWWKTAGQVHSAKVVIAWFMKFISTKSFMPFVYYRVGLGVLLIVLLATGAMSAT